MVMPLFSLFPVSQLFSVSGDFPASGLPHHRLENACVDAVILFVGSRNHDGGRRGHGSWDRSVRSQFDLTRSRFSPSWSYDSCYLKVAILHRETSTSMNFDLWAPQCDLRPSLLYNDWRSVGSEVREIDRW